MRNNILLTILLLIFISTSNNIILAERSYDKEKSDKMDKHDIECFHVREFLNIVVKYLYTGNNEYAWELFNKYYNLENKESIKKELEDIYNKDKNFYKNIE